uniref:Hsp70like protein putative n=1 Tax=Albugo laibachii Nc14 TaxID=890382 RepID=F0WLX8_9STRA|nr:hsp70like protein putative [Albugo laibachii Nc14]|eukprot:CCA22305.1 hsp70like protein putative [Albugo laibachii Nc14]
MDHNELEYDSWGRGADAFDDTTIAIGIDFGTTNSCVGVWLKDQNRVKIFKHGIETKWSHLLPSVVRYDPVDISLVLVGKEAIELESKPPCKNTIRCVKRLMGQKYVNDRIAYLQSSSIYEIVSTQRGNAAIQIDGDHGDDKRTSVEPEEVAAHILIKLKARAEAYFDHKAIENVVLTVPAHFNDGQRKATIRAASMAGFKKIRLLNEPTAAAMAYGLFIAGKKQVLVFDFGGGTLDVSLMQIHEGRFRVVAIGGDTNLGGEDINQMIIDHILQSFEEKEGILQLTIDQKAAMKQSIEQAKIQLSNAMEAVIKFEHKTTWRQYALSRDVFESICDSVWTRCISTIQGVLQDASVDPCDVDEVVMVGGSTRIPKLRSKISEVFDNKALCESVNADQVVCEGAAIQAAVLSGMDRKVLQDVLMLDVIPLSMGLETADGRMEVILPKNSQIPAQVTKYFQTFEDDQRGISVDVYEGEHPIARENEHICRFDFPIPTSKIDTAGRIFHPVTFRMNENGVLHVTAGIHHPSEEAPMSKSAIALMILYAVCLLVLYVTLRIYFASERL